MCTVSIFFLRNLFLLQPSLCSAFKLRQKLPVHPACFLPFSRDFLPATVDHFWGLRRLSCKIRLLPWVPWFFREVCHGNLAHRSLNRPKICFPTVQDCNSAGSLALFAYSLLSSLHHLHCHQPLPPQLAFLCPPVGFASLLVKQENASPVGSLITCDVKLSSTHSVNLCTVQCCLQPEWHCLLVSGSEMWFSRFVSSFSPSHAPGCKNGFVWFEKDILNINLLKDGGCLFWEEVLRWKMRDLAVWQKQRRT